MSLLPAQAPPVRRPELIDPYRTLDIVHATPEQLGEAILRLRFNANFNDPAHYALPSALRMRASAASGPQATAL